MRLLDFFELAVVHISTYENAFSRFHKKRDIKLARKSKCVMPKDKRGAYKARQLAKDICEVMKEMGRKTSKSKYNVKR